MLDSFRTHTACCALKDVLKKLEGIAPVTAVRGNNDFGDWAEAIPERAAVTAGGVRILVLHDISELGPARGFGVVVTGHSHQPKAERRDGTVGRLTIAAGTIEHELISL